MLNQRFITLQLPLCITRRVQHNFPSFYLASFHSLHITPSISYQSINQPQCPGLGLGRALPEPPSSWACPGHPGGSEGGANPFKQIPQGMLSASSEEVSPPPWLAQPCIPHPRQGEVPTPPLREGTGTARVGTEGTPESIPRCWAGVAAPVAPTGCWDSTTQHGKSPKQREGQEGTLLWGQGCHTVPPALLLQDVPQDHLGPAQEEPGVRGAGGAQCPQPARLQLPLPSPG